MTIHQWNMTTTFLIQKTLQLSNKHSFTAHPETTFFAWLSFGCGCHSVEGHKIVIMSLAIAHHPVKLVVDLFKSPGSGLGSIASL